MTYYPKKMVNNNLYTNGGEFFDSTSGKEYAGPYHETYDGKVFSGKNPLDPNKSLLSKVTSFSQSGISELDRLPNNINYQNLGNTPKEIYRFGIDPESYIPKLIGQDYKRGQIIRYFATKRNQTPPRIIEISKNTYDSILKKSGTYNYALWRVTSVLWKITGPLRNTRDRNGILIPGIVDTNEKLVNQANQQIRGIKQYLSNLIQFSIKPDLTLISNQYTSGNEFTIKLDNSNYIGYYHVTADGVIKDGATQEQSQGKILLPTNVVIQNQINTLIKSELEKIGAV